MKLPVASVLSALALLLAGCRREMYDQPRGDPLKSSDFFPNGSASQPLPDHTVPQENFHADAVYETGKEGTNFAQVPFPITRDLLKRGQDRYDIYCAVCHGLDGQGHGMVVQRGFPAPPSYDIERLRTNAPGYFFYVMTRGYGVMYSYANRVDVNDRWAIAAYIRALQLSHHAALADVPEKERAKLESESR